MSTNITRFHIDNSDGIAPEMLAELRQREFKVLLIYTDMGEILYGHTCTIKEALSLLAKVTSDIVKEV